MISCVDVVQEEAIRGEAMYWKSVLERAVDVIKFLAERGLSFRGHDEKFGSLANSNYMGVLELLARYNSFLASHIEKHGYPGQGKKNLPIFYNM